MKIWEKHALSVAFSLILILNLCSVCTALTTHWDTTNGDWCTAANWDEGLPASDVHCAIAGDLDGAGPTIASGCTAAAQRLRGPGRNPGDDVTLTITGGSLTTTSFWRICQDGGKGVVNMSGGTVVVNNTLYIPYVDEAATRDADFNLSGGSVTVDGFEINTGGLMDITGGTLIIDGDVRSTINGYITANKLISSTGTLDVDYNVTNSGKTTVTYVAPDTTAPTPDPTSPPTTGATARRGPRVLAVPASRHRSACPGTRPST